VWTGHDEVFETLFDSLLQDGGRVIEWTERADSLWAERDRLLDAPDLRLRKLENGGAR
jgi:hypothetical protein